MLDKPMRPVGRPPGLPKTGGRKRGVPNRSMRELQSAVSGKPLQAAISVLVDLAQHAKNERTRLAAASLLVRCSSRAEVSSYAATALAQLLRPPSQ